MKKSFVIVAFISASIFLGGVAVRAKLQQIAYAEKRSEERSAVRAELQQIAYAEKRSEERSIDLARSESIRIFYREWQYETEVDQLTGNTISFASKMSRISDPRAPKSLIIKCGADGSSSVFIEMGSDFRPSQHVSSTVRFSWNSASPISQYWSTAEREEAFSLNRLFLAKEGEFYDGMRNGGRLGLGFDTVSSDFGLTSDRLMSGHLAVWHDFELSPRARELLDECHN